jgi:hypothetical protein
MIGAQRETFVAKPGRFRIFVQTAGLSLCAGVFLTLAVVTVMLDAASGLGLVIVLAVAVAMVALAAFCLVFLTLNAVRIEVGPERLKLRLPRWRGPMPLPSLIRAELPYGDIAAVEHREEIYSSFGLVTIGDAYSLVLRDGTRIRLGWVWQGESNLVPLDRAAERIAQRAGCSVRDRGGVRAGGVVRAITRDVPAWGSETIITPVERKLCHARALRSMQALGVMLAVIALLRACAR